MQDVERCEAEARRPTPWAFLRLALGLAQMAGAVVSFLLLLTLGVHAWSLTAAAATAVTAASVLFFPRTSAC